MRPDGGSGQEYCNDNEQSEFRPEPPFWLSVRNHYTPTHSGVFVGLQAFCISISLLSRTAKSSRSNSAAPRKPKDRPTMVFNNGSKVENDPIREQRTAMFDVT